MPRFRKHGRSTTRIYYVWSGMRHRCDYPNDTAYKWYGAKGVTVCPDWYDFETFEAWALTNGYAPGLSIDRIDNSLGYSPDNCKWSTPTEQTAGRKCSCLIEYMGVTMTRGAWAKFLGVDQGTIKDRVERGWSIEDALLLPALKGVPDVSRQFESSVLQPTPDYRTRELRILSGRSREVQS